MDASEAMQQAIVQAYRVEGRTSPRPPVGAVVVQTDQVVGIGATAPPYGPHAEVTALAMAGVASRGADLYVTLEPCCITAHTPPCTEMIIAAGIRRVFIAQIDPNPAIAGRGIEQLRAAGIIVYILPSSYETQRLLRPFATYITQRRPYITAKWAMTLDGKIASTQGDAFWISNARSREQVHDLRDRVDAIMIGANTARIDNPYLTVRLTPEQLAQTQRTPRPDPWRIIMSSDGSLADTLHVLQAPLAERTLVIVGDRCASVQQKRIRASGADVIAVNCDEQGKVDLQRALHVLAEKGIMHILLEGGTQLFSSAFEARYVDEVVVFVAPILLGGKHALTAIAGPGNLTVQQAWSLENHDMQFQQIDNDVMITGTVNYKHAPIDTNVDAQQKQLETACLQENTHDYGK